MEGQDDLEDNDESNDEEDDEEKMGELGEKKGYWLKSHNRGLGCKLMISPELKR